jgi:hypothetical protein
MGMRQFFLDEQLVEMRKDFLEHFEGVYLSAVGWFNIFS